MALSTRGVLAGTPQTSLDGVVVFKVTDSTGTSVFASLQLDIGSGPIMTTQPLPAPVVGVPYSFQFTSTGGTAPYVWSVTGGPLPVGLVLNSSGLLSGIPSATGTTTTTIAVTDALGSRTAGQFVVTVEPSAIAPQVYFVSSSLGGVSAYASPGVAVPQTGGDSPAGVVGIATDRVGDRYWLVTAAGRVSASRGARAFGSVGKHRLLGTIVGIAAEPDGSGYWLASSTGHVYGFGSAHSFGSVGKRHLSGTIVGIAAEPDGSGYWLASSTGHVYGFGSARALRERGGTRLNPTIVGIAADPVANGYWTVTRAGRVYAFGNAAPFGSIAGRARVRSANGIAADASGAGYWVATSSGAVYAFGNATLLAGVEIAPGTGASAIAGAA
jgi:hypothetical protein